jgi:hypothetical protein
VNCRFNVELSSDEERTLRVRQPVITMLIMYATRSAIIANEHPAGWYAIRSVSLIIKSVPSVRDRLLIENYPRTIARTAILRDRGPVGAGSSRRPLISTVSGPVLDTMGPKVCPILLPSRCILSLSSAGRLRAIRVGKPSTCAILGPETAHKGRLWGPFRSDKRWSTGTESETS